MLNNRFQRFPNGAPIGREGFEFVAFGATDKGLKRSENEDSFLVRQLNTELEPAYLLAVADGVGGNRGGQFASRLALEILRNTFYLNSSQPPAQRLLAALEIANQRILKQAELDYSLRGSATTLTAVFVQEERVYVAHLGNSRAYLVRNREIRQLTRDQTMAQMMLDFGNACSDSISPAAHKTLLQAVGVEPIIDIWQASADLGADDLLLVCSDGLTAQLSESEICRIIEDNSDRPEWAVRQLIARANELGGDDNITAIVGQLRQVARMKKPIPWAAEFEETPLVFRAAA